jgi:hypothetical protein
MKKSILQESNNLIYFIKLTNILFINELKVLIQFFVFG